MSNIHAWKELQLIYPFFIITTTDPWTYPGWSLASPDDPRHSRPATQHACTPSVLLQDILFFLNALYTYIKRTVYPKIISKFNRIKS